MPMLETKRALADEARASLNGFNELVNNHECHPDLYESWEAQWEGQDGDCVVPEEYREEQNLIYAIRGEMRRLRHRCLDLEAEATAAERVYLKRDADKLGLNILIEGGRYIVVRDGQVNAITRGTFEEVAKALDDMLASDEFAPSPL